MPTLCSMVNETGNRNRILERCKIRFCLVHWIDPRSIEHNYACSWCIPSRQPAVDLPAVERDWLMCDRDLHHHGTTAIVYIFNIEQ